MKLAGLLSCLVVACAGPGLAAQAPQPTQKAADTTAMTGRVMDESGSVIVGASISLTPVGAGDRRETTTDATGAYRLDHLVEGSYVALIFRDGLAPLTQDVVVARGETLTRDFKLGVASFAEEVTVNFKASNAPSTLKMDVPLADVPLAVQSYTSSFIKAIETTNVGDLYNYTTGVARSGNTGIDFLIRGVRASNTGNIQYNGLPGLAARFGSPSTANVERIEVIKGPSSLLYGQAQPGGIINIITKKPQAERANLLDIRSGTFFGTGPGFGDRNTYHLSTDLTGPIDAGRKFLYRFVGSYDDANDFREFAQNRDLYLVPSISWLGWNGAVINFELEYRRTRTALDSGLVAPNNDITRVARIDVRYQEPSDYLNENGKTATFSLRKSLPNGAAWSVNWRSVWHGDDTNGFENVGVSGLSVQRRDRHQVNQRRYHYLDTTLVENLMTGPVRHKLLFGVNGGYELTDFNRLQFATSPSLNVNLYNPVYGASVLPLKPDTHRYTPAWSWAGYVSDQIEMSRRWKALVGLRYDRRDSQEQELRINPYVKEKNSQAALPLAGLVFEPSPSWSLYGSYSTSFTPPPPGAVDAHGNNPFTPEHAHQFEGGVKATLNQGRGETSLSVFDITKNDVLITLVAQAINDQIGQEQSRGVEATFTERLLANWQVISGYAFTDSVVTKDSDPVRVGSRIPNASRHAANLWTRYDIQSGTLHGLGFGLGLVYTGERAGTIKASTSKLPVLSLPSYFRTDLGIYWVAARYELTALVTNLLDEQYYESNLGTGTTGLNIRPGSPRAATLSMRVRF